MSELLMVGGLMLGILLFLYMIGVPVAIAMGLSVIAMWVSPFGDGINFTVISTRMLFGINSFPLLAIPFYVLLGRLMNNVGMTDRIFRFAASLVGHYRGGIAHVNVLASMVFAGMSGLSTADAAGLGRIEYTAMREYGYSKSDSLGITSASTLIGPLIPPSVSIIIYSVLAEQSIGQMFLAGLLPGVLMGLALMVFVVILSYYKGFEYDGEFSLSEVVSSLRESALALLTPLLVIGGILSGVFTATEAGAIAVVYIAIIGSTVYGELSFSDLYEEIQNSMIETATLTFILAMASLYGLAALQLGVPTLLVQEFAGLTDNPTYLLLILVFIFLIVGTFMDTIAAMTVLVPIVLPLLNAAGIDLVHFGIVMFIALLLGLLTPPFGIILFVMEKVTDASLEEVFRAVVPYYVPILVVLLLCIFVPEVVTYVPFETMG